MFEYQIVLTINDNFGNSYSNIQFGPFPVSVRVSDTKQALGGAATAAMVIAVVLYALSWLITSAPGHTAQGIGDGLGAAALDPPEPDPKFEEEVHIRYRRVADVYKKLNNFRSLGIFLQLCSRIATASLTLSKIEGRILGAKEQKHKEGITLQSNSYRKVLQAMMVDAANLQANAIAATNELNTISKSTWQKTNRILNTWIKNGIDGSFKQNATKAGIPKDDVQAIEETLKYPLFIDQLRKGLDVNMKEINQALLKYAADSLDYGSQYLNVTNFKKR
jgi:hypothetical protein